MFRKLLSLTFLLMLTVSCGGGGGGGSSLSVPVSGTLKGVAARGDPMAYAQITLTDAVGTKLTATTDADGNYFFSIDPFRLFAPFALLAIDPDRATEFQVSIAIVAPAAGATITANINPLTSTVVAGSLDSGLIADLADPATLRSVSASDVIAAQLALRFCLRNLLSTAGLPSSVDLISAPMVANHSGLDSVLDKVQVVPTGNGVQITHINAAEGSNQTVTVSKRDLALLASTVFF